MPQAEARTVLPFFYLEKKNEDGDFIGGSKWRITVDEWHEYPGFDDELSRYSRLCHSVSLSYVVEDNKSLKDVGDDVVYQKASDFLSPDAYAEFEETGMLDDCIIEDSNWSDQDPDGGKILVNDLFQGLAKRITITEIESPEGYGPGSEGPPSVTFERRSVATYDSENRQWVYHPEPEDSMGVSVISSSGLYEPVVGKYRFGDDYYRGQHHKPKYEGVFPDGSKVSGGWVYPVGQFTNVRIPETTTITETVTETPEPSTTTVTPPTTTVTLPSTVTTTVTPPATTVTETPKTETTTATTTEPVTTTVTQTPQTETVTETPERETVTLTPEKETETVTETPEKETVTETPKTETVTHTPEKETVTETPKASTETSTVTAPQVTVTETPKQVTETVTLPQKTVTEQVPTTVVENKTETVKVPPVTVTTTEKQEPTTVTETPEKTTVVETQPSETTVGSSSSSVESSAPVETTTPSETSTPTSERGTASRVLASTGANVVGFAVLAGLLAGLGVFVTRRRE